MSFSPGTGTTEPIALPALNVWTVEDDDDLWVAIQALVCADGAASRRQADVEDWVQLLTACIDDEGVLRVADEVRTRVLAEAEELALAIARWAFAEGRRASPERRDHREHQKDAGAEAHSGGRRR